MTLLSVLLIGLGACGKSVKNTSVNTPPNAREVITPPTVQVGEDFFAKEESPIVLSGEASSAHDIISYSWAQIEGPTASNLGGQSSPSASYVTPKVSSQAILTFEFTVKDRAGGVSTKQIKVIVNPVNELPTISSSLNYDVAEQTWLDIDTQITDPDGSIKDIQWTQIAGPQIEILDDSQAAIRFLAPAVSETKDIILEVLAIDNEDGFSREQLNITVSPVFIPPTIGDLTPINTKAYDLVGLTADVSDTDGEIKKVAWRQIAGTPVTLQTGPAEQAHFVAPPIETVETLVFEIGIEDDDGLEASQQIEVKVSPAEFLTLPAVISYAPELVTAQIEVRRVFRNRLKSEAYVLDMTADEFGFFTLAIPGRGLYEITSKSVMRYPGSPDVSSDTVALTALVDTTQEGARVNINMLTHLTHKRIMKILEDSPQLSFDEAQLIAENQLRTTLEPLITNSEVRDFASLGIYESSRTDRSDYLSAFTTMVSWYALSRSTSEHLYKEVSAVLEELLDDFSENGDIALTSSAFQGIEATRKDVDSRLINALLQAKTFTNPAIQASDVENHFDFDSDGIVNALDPDDDNDGIDDQNDAFPLGHRFTPTGCQIRNRIDPRTLTSGKVNILNLWKPDQHLNYKSSRLQASPLISQHDPFAEWEITRINGSGHFTIRNTDSGLYLGFTPGNASNLSLAESVDQDNFYYWTFLPEAQNPQNPSFFHIQNVGKTDYQLKTNGRSEAGFTFGVLSGMKEPTGALSTLWSFCAVEPRNKQPESYQAQEAFPETPCTQTGSTEISAFEEKTYLIQNSWRPSQYLNRLFGLNASPIISAEALSGQWLITPKFGTDLFYIQSRLEDKLYLGIGSGSTNRLVLDNKPSTDDDSFLWHFDRIVPNSSYLGYRIHNAGHEGFYLETAPGPGSTANDLHGVRVRSAVGSGVLALHWLVCDAPAP